MPERTFVPQACSTQTLSATIYWYQDDFNPGMMWIPRGSAMINPGPGSMDVTCNAPTDGAEQTVPCDVGAMNTMDLTFTSGNNDIQVTIYDAWVENLRFCF